ncbi:MAG: YihY/virulence factor BrkB family protein [Phycisphaerales bacterium]
MQRITRESEQVRQTAHVSRRVLRSIYRSQIPRMAAALAYRTIFSIIPVFVISLLVLGSLVSDDQVEFGIKRLLDFSGLNQIVVEDTAGDEGFVGPPAPIAADAPPPAPVPGEGLAGVGRLDQLIGDLVQRVNTSLARIPTTSIAVVSALILIYAALSMLVELERSFNQVCRAPAGRPWLRRIVLYWTVLTLGGMLLAATFSVGDLFVRWATSLVGGAGAAAAALGFVVTVGISTLLLFVAYVTVPNTRVRVRPALAGAVVAAVGWEIGKWGFRSYVGWSTGYAKFYGSLALLPLFLLWVYVTWIIVLFGLQVAYATQTAGEWDESEQRPHGPTLVDPASILLVAVGVARRFARGESAMPSELAEEVGLSDALTARMLQRLAEQKVVHAVEVGEDRAFALARPPESIRARDVLAAAAALTDRRPAGDDAALRALTEARDRAIGERTLADLAATPPDEGVVPGIAANPA